MTYTREFIIITTINPPTQAIKTIVKTRNDWNILIVADKKTPLDWSCQNTNLLSVEDQLAFDSAFARECPWNHYARKNIGYLKAIKDGAEVIAETDDDNIPKGTFLSSVRQRINGRLVKKRGWENVYTHFTDSKIWPRGFPPEYINQSFEARSPLGPESIFDCPIQQYLTDGDPDVDAIYRLTIKGGTNFHPNTIVLSKGTFCPFNSQNTIWWPQAFPLLYLPSFVSFRMTDIWRSFIAQICLYKAGKQIAYREATMFQVRNEHSLISDFKDEIPGYLNNIRIMELLSGLTLSGALDRMGENMRICYEKLAEADIIPQDEIHLVDLWLKDIEGR